MTEKTKAKVELAVFVLIVITICALLTRGQDPPPIFGGAVRQAGQSLAGILWPRADVVFLDSENGLWVKPACEVGLRRLATVKNVTGQLIGIDYRPADGLLYGLDDTGAIYTIDAQGAATLVSRLTVPFGGDQRSLMDFNPVVNALRLIGANDQNYAVVGAGLAATVAQTALAYAAGDVNFGVNPNIVGGAYTNNVAGATQTTFYGIDYDLDTFVTIAQLNATGSSNTGGGQLQTIGRLLRGGRKFDLQSTADFDIYTVDGVNKVIGVNGGRIFTIDLDQIQPLSLGQTQDVHVRVIPFVNDHFIDIAVGPPASGCQ